MYTIALVEDEAILRELIQLEMEKKGFKIYAASNGEEGLALVKEKKPDLLLLDLLMPIMSGYEVLHALRKIEEFKKLPCIVISNSGQVDDLNRAYAYGANDVLIKADFNPSQVIDKVQKLLDSKNEKPQAE